MSGDIWAAEHQFKGKIRGGHSRHRRSRSKGLKAEQVGDAPRTVRVSWEAGAMRVGRGGGKVVPWWGPLGSGSLSEVWRREGIWEMAGRKRNRAQATEKWERKN